RVLEEPLDQEASVHVEQRVVDRGAPQVDASDDLHALSPPTRGAVSDGDNIPQSRLMLVGLSMVSVQLAAGSWRLAATAPAGPGAGGRRQGSGGGERKQGQLPPQSRELCRCAAM